MIQPPAVRVQATSFECTAKDNGDLWLCYLKAVDSIKSCNMDKKAIADFYKETPTD